MYSLTEKKHGRDNASVILIALLPDAGGCRKANRRITETASNRVDGLKEDQKTD